MRASSEDSFSDVMIATPDAPSSNKTDIEMPIFERGGEVVASQARVQGGLNPRISKGSFFRQWNGQHHYAKNAAASVFTSVDIVRRHGPVSNAREAAVSGTASIRTGRRYGELER